MLSTLFFSAKLIFGVFTFSSATAYFICIYNNVPFYNPSFTRYKLIDRFEQIVKTSGLGLSQSVVIYSFFLDRLIENKSHSIIASLYVIAMYSIIAEFFYYSSHRLIHFKNYYSDIHSKHHENVVIYPYDAFHVEKKDAILLFCSLGSPILFIQFNYFEFITCLYIYVTATYLAHSSSFFNHHAIHHKLPTYNFCILNPAYDIIFNTYRG